MAIQQGDRPLAGRAGELTQEQATAQGIKAWIAANPTRRQELFNVNPIMCSARSAFRMLA
jgi:hypothetical protein